MAEQRLQSNTTFTWFALARIERVSRLHHEQHCIWSALSPALQIKEHAVPHTLAKIYRHVIDVARLRPRKLARSAIEFTSDFGKAKERRYRSGQKRVSRDCRCTNHRGYRLRSVGA